MSLEWWEYYEINHRVRNLKEDIERLEKEIKSLHAEVETLKGTKAKRSIWGRLAGPGE
ncbi:MAG: hypothetical protein WBD24_03945 [Candidatus Omnitrophota bacterium]